MKVFARLLEPLAQVVVVTYEGTSNECTFTQLCI